MISLILAAVAIFSICNGATFTSQIDLSNVTAPNISKWIYGMNMYQPYGLDNHYTGNYTIGRHGGNGNTRFNFSINAANSANDYFYITSHEEFTWQNRFNIATGDGLSLWVQIPTMGWVSGTTTKCWSFSQQKYGAQQKNECTNQPDGTTWCAKDAGNGIWVNGSDVVGNNPYDASIRTNVQNARDFVSAVDKAYPGKGVVYSVDNEPTLWSGTHRDVHPKGSTYDEIVNATLSYGAAIKQTCANCMVAGYSPWGWCGYFEDGYDHEAGFCSGRGPDYKAKGNTPLAIYYLQEMKNYEKTNNKRLLDIMDVHFYANSKFSCDESTAESIETILQAPRSLYDWSYIDGSWIKDPIALIPRFKGYINQYYPGTKFSISEYSFGGDDCITSVIAHSEALAIYATYGVDVATRWSKPKPGSMVINAFNIFTNYDGKGSNIYSSNPFAVNVKDSNIEIVTSYSFIAANKSKMFTVFYNKDQSNTNTVSASLINNSDNISISGNIDVYGVDKSGNLRYIGTVTPTNANSFSIDLAPWSIRLAIASL